MLNKSLKSVEMTHLEYSLGKDGGGIPKETIRKRERETDRENILTNCMFVSTVKVGWIKLLTFFKMLLVIKPVIIGKHTELPI